MGVDVILGLQWGDEGKGKIVDFLANQYDIVCRFQGGPNAGHTIKLGENKYVLHTVPSGVFRAGIINVIGNGVVLDPITFVKELANLDTANVEYKNRLLIAKKAHFILPTHRYLDAASEAAKGSSKIGSTLKGIGPTYMDKTGRNGLRVGDIFSPHFFDKYKQLKEKHLGLLKLYPEIEFNLDREEALWFESIGQIKSLQFIDSEYYLNEALNNGKRLLAEGAQGSMLDVDFGTYPFVTSSNTTVSGVCNGLGISPQKIDKVIGIAKAYCTRVGSGPFPSELDNEVGEQLRQKGFEFGATTGRPRRCGWLDIPQLRYSVMVNGVTDLIITKMDVLDGFEKVEMVTSYKDINGAMTDKIPFDIVDRKIETVTTAFKGWQDELSKVQSYAEFPEVAKDYLAEISQRTGTRVSMVSTGPEREKTFLKYYLRAMNEIVSIYRRAHFNAAHRLFVSQWSDEENSEFFGKCSNPYYHGHNYELEVRLTGAIDPVTGFLFDMTRLKDLIKIHVEDRFDHKNLNVECAEFKHRNPTAENICVVIYNILREYIPVDIKLRVKLWETPRNYVSYPVD